MTTRIFALTAVLTLAGAGCALEKQPAPGLAGPSELGLSLAITATPDIITQDGQSQAVVEIVARDASSQPVSSLTLRAETSVNGVPVDLGFLSSKTVSTGNDGRASLTYRSPAPPPLSQSSDIIVTIDVTPVGTNFQASVSRSVAIRLARPGVVLPPNGTPVPIFTFSPKTPRAFDDVFFDASASTDSDGSIVTYAWSFGDGHTEVSSSPTADHSYALPGTYLVTLTVTDDRGISATSAPVEIEVTDTDDPTASFTASPAAPLTGDAVSFNGSGSKAAVGRVIVDYLWDFGDGSPPISTGANPIASHVYTNLGEYTVNLRVTDDAGRFGSAVVTVTVCDAVLGCPTTDDGEE